MPSIQLAAKLEGERTAYEREITGALDDVVAFFQEAGSDLGTEGLIDSVIVFGGTAEAKKYLAKAFGVAPEDLPATFSGTVIGRTLFLISREAYQGTWKQLYTDWPWTSETYHGLIVHELAHRAHELIAVAQLGSADAMGPTWFFEGLAVVCAGQFAGCEPLMTREEIEQQVTGSAVPKVSYPLYGRLVRSLAGQFPLKTLIMRASEIGFPATMWAK
jgi:hypothetical protein